MKTIITFAALALTATVASATEVKTLYGCELKKATNGNYYMKADPACLFTGVDGLDGVTGPDAPLPDDE
jgi:hypothetical protein